jgi:hypothetical protein
LHGSAYVLALFCILIPTEHEHPSPSHLLIKFLKLFKLIPSRKSFGSSFHHFAAPYLSECKPYLVVLTLGMLTVLLYLKEQELFFIVTKSCNYTGVCLFIILKTSIAMEE